MPAAHSAILPAPLNHVSRSKHCHNSMICAMTQPDHALLPTASAGDAGLTMINDNPNFPDLPGRPARLQAVSHTAKLHHNTITSALQMLVQ